VRDNGSSLTGKRILVFRIGELGDTLIALPALRAIRESFPAAHISFLSNIDAEAEHVNPHQILPQGLIDDWVSYPMRNGRSSFKDQVALLRSLRRRHYDVLVYLAPRLRSRQRARRDVLFFRLAGIPRMIGAQGFASLPRGTNGSLPNVAHEADHLLYRLSLDGIMVPGRVAAQFDLALTENETAAAEVWLKRHVSGLGDRVLVGIGPGSKWPSKVWPEERFAELGSRLVESERAFPVVFGGAEEWALGERLISGWGQGANAAGELSVREAAGALERCDIYVGNDTGTMHLAAAVGTPCVAIMSAQDWPGRWQPYGSGHFVLRRSVPCEGCLLQTCEVQAMRCLKEIGVEEVFNACCGAIFQSTGSRRRLYQV
jgi:heptosyltransferase III